MEEAVRVATSLAEPGDAVLLSPACTSYDQYRSFEERGLSFRQQPLHTRILFIDDTAHFTVDLAGGLLRVVAFFLRRLDLHHERLTFTISPRREPKWNRMLSTVPPLASIQAASWSAIRTGSWPDTGMMAELLSHHLWSPGTSW